MKTRIPSGGFAGVTAMLALVVALGGTSVAAATLAKNSVGTKQLKDDAVVGAKVADHSLTKKDFKAHSLPAGPTGPTGPTGPAGPAGPLVDTVPSGHSIRGTWIITTGATTSTGIPFFGLVGLTYPLATNPIVVVVPAGSPASTNCPGTANGPQAAAGYLCVYATSGTGLSAPTFFGVSGDTDYRYGIVLVATNTIAGSLYVRGTWAATAP